MVINFVLWCLLIHFHFGHNPVPIPGLFIMSSCASTGVRFTQRTLHDFFDIKNDEQEGEGCHRSAPVMRAVQWVDAFVQDTANHSGFPPPIGRGQFKRQAAHAKVHKRSFLRACRRAHKVGYTWYRGHMWKPSDFPSRVCQQAASIDICSSRSPPLPSSHHPKGRLHFLHWNSGGLSQAKFLELKLWLDSSHLDGAIISETRLWTKHTALTKALHVKAKQERRQRSLFELETLKRNIAHLLDTLEELHMKIQYNKSQIIFAVGGSSSKRVLQEHVQRTANGAFFQLSRSDGKKVQFPLTDRAKYLGVVLGYRMFEDHTVEHRVTAGRAAFSRLRGWLKSGTIGLRWRLQLLYNSVFTVISYGLFSTGFTIKGLHKLQSVMLGMLRHVIGNHSFLTRQSHQDVLHAHCIVHPLLHLHGVGMQIWRNLTGRSAQLTTDDILHQVDWTVLPEHLTLVKLVHDQSSEVWPTLASLTDSQVKHHPIPVASSMETYNVDAEGRLRLDHLHAVQTQTFGQGLLDIVRRSAWQELIPMTEATEYLVHHCCICGAWCNRTQELNAHLKLHHGAFMKGVLSKSAQVCASLDLGSPCALCHKPFKKQHTCNVLTQGILLWLSTLTSADRDAALLTCAVCDQQLDDLAHLHRHLRTHDIQTCEWNAARDRLPGAEHACRHCGMIFSTSDGLRRHVLDGRCDHFDEGADHVTTADHSRWLPIIQQGSFGRLTAHERLSLTLKCQMCSSSYTRQCDLSSHLQQSHGELWHSSLELLRLLIHFVTPERGCLCNPATSETGLSHICTGLRQLAMIAMHSHQDIVVPMQFTTAKLEWFFGRIEPHAAVELIKQALLNRDFAQLWTLPDILQYLRHWCVLCGGWHPPGALTFHLLHAHHPQLCESMPYVTQLADCLHRACTTDWDCYACGQLFNHPVDSPNVAHIAARRATQAVHLRSNCPVLLQLAVLFTLPDGSYGTGHGGCTAPGVLLPPDPSASTGSAVSSRKRRGAISEEAQAGPHPRRASSEISHPAGGDSANGQGGPHTTPAARAFCGGACHSNIPERLSEFLQYLEIFFPTLIILAFCSGAWLRWTHPFFWGSLTWWLTSLLSTSRGISSAAELWRSGQCLQFPFWDYFTPCPFLVTFCGGVQDDYFNLRLVLATSRSIFTDCWLFDILDQHCAFTLILLTFCSGVLAWYLCHSGRGTLSLAILTIGPKICCREFFQTACSLLGRIEAFSLRLTDLALRLIFSGTQSAGHWLVGFPCPRHVHIWHISDFHWLAATHYWRHTAQLVFVIWSLPCALLLATLALEHSVWHLKFFFCVFLVYIVTWAPQWTFLSTSIRSISPKCRSGPKSRRNSCDRRVWRCWIAFVVLYNMLTFAEGSYRGEGGSSAMGAAEEQPEWLHLLSQQPCSKRHGIQPPFHGNQIIWHPQQSKIVKRSLKRALRRAQRDGLAWYHGRCYVPDNFPSNMKGSLPTVSAGHAPDNVTSRRCNVKHQDRRRVRYLNWNCNGLSAGKLTEIKAWMRAQGIQVGILTETRWRYENSWEDEHWSMIHTGSSSHAGMGILCLIDKQLCKPHDIRWRPVIDGRVLHVQLRLSSRCMDVVGVYQHTQAPTKQRRTERALLWQELDACLHHLPRRNVLLLTGDFNCSLLASQSYTGPAEFVWKNGLVKGAQHPDQDQFMQLLRNHGLCALNSFNPKLGPSYVKGNSCSRIDYALTRKQFADGMAKAVCYIWEAPFVAEDGEGHVPMIGQLLKLWIPPTWDSTNAGITYQQRLQGRTESQASTERWRGFLQESGMKLHHRLEQALTSDFDAALIPDLHCIASHSFCQWFPAGHTSPSNHPDIAGHQILHNKWHHRKIYLSFHKPCLQSVFSAWRHLTRFCVLKRQQHRHAYQVRKLKFQDAIQSAQKAADQHDSFKLFQIINGFCPKLPRKRIQLRNASGQLATPVEELAILKHHVQDIWSGPATFPVCIPDDTGLPFTEGELLRMLQDIPTTKAVARPCAPGVIWKAHAPMLAPLLYQLLQVWWSHPVPHIPAWWRDSWLLLIPKPRKPPTSPALLRPLALQEPLGKCLIGLLTRVAVRESNHVMIRYPLWGYLQLRSTQDPILRITNHCKAVRSMMEAHRSNVFARARGAQRHRICGGIKVFVDLSRAFDSVCRPTLFAKLVTLPVNPKIIQLLTLWHQHTNYHVSHNGTDHAVEVGKGVRQGCRAAPWLFNCFMLFFLQELSELVPFDWLYNCVDLFADDSAFGGSFTSLQELHDQLAYIGIALDLLNTMGMTISPSKSAALFALSGTSYKRVRHTLMQRRDNQEWLKICTGSTEMLIPVVTQTTYLGAVMSYQRLEDLTMRHRVQLARSTFSRLQSWLTGRKGLAIKARMRLWETCVFPVLAYSLCTVGITAVGLQQIQICIFSMVRRILNNPAHVTGHSHLQVFERYNIDLPALWLWRTADKLQRSNQRRFSQASPHDIVHTLDWSHLDDLKAFLLAACHAGPVDRRTLQYVAQL
eukprot:s475_g7.t2